MKQVTITMMNEWKMNDMDWMGYTLEKDERFSYHHLIIPKRKHGPENIANGAILIQTAGHDYLHTIERCNRDMFEYLTDLLIVINRQHSMPTKEQLVVISNTLKEFETEWLGVRTHKGRPIVKERYLRRKY